MWSYCENTHARSASIANRSAEQSVGAGNDSPSVPLGGAGASGRSYNGAASCSDAAGTSARTGPSNPSRMRSAPPSVTRPTTDARTSQRSQISMTRARLAGSTMASMRSCDSLVMISKGSIHASRTGTARTSTSMPTPPRDAVSLVAHVSPAPPRSWIPTTRPSSSRVRHASMRRFSSNGSPTCTLGRLSASASPSPKPAEASTLTPPMPSRPVDDPSSTARLPTPDARPSTSRSVGNTPRHNTLTSGLPR